ncbi:MAG: excinuclease ABC subunit UvrA [Candidatus Gastranaerophilales bacterium]|nr:excinuclease ABC subunit UvrA [Candidatus Gastranaerophilales bacterium]
MKDKIIIRKANQHNLKNVSLELPKNELIVFTGISGSGKSSLAFDTIFAEGQRRYVESLSNYARQFLGQLDKPDVESIEGLSPAISIDQKSTSNNPRSTVGTVTEIYDYLRLLFARIGTPHCPECGSEIAPQSIDEIIDKIFTLQEGTKIQLLAPIVRGKKGEYINLLEELKQEGFVRVRIDGEIYSLEEDEIELSKTQKHTIEIVVDRIIIKESAKSRLTDSAQIALEKSDGLLLVDVIGGKELIFSEKLACPNCNLSYEELAPRTFSFNSPYGACPECSGLGAHFDMDENLLIPDKTKSLRQGAIYPWAKTGNSYYQEILESVSSHFSIDMDTPFEDLPEKHQKIILYGSGRESVKLRFKEFGGTRYITQKRPFVGVIPYYMNKYNETNSEETRDAIQEYMSQTPCSVCNGARLNKFALAVTIMDKNIYDVCKMSIKDAHKFFSDLYLELDDYKLTIAKQILEEIRARLKFMLDVGLSYLDLSRMSGTLSGGEAQRIRLATQIGSGLSGVLYVLDEPSIGLHQYNNDMLIKTLIRLRNLGNTLIVVEHDEDTIRSADHIVDIGTHAGIKGGKVIAQGTIEDIINTKKSLTGQYLSGERTIPIPKERRKGNGNYLHVINAHKNNLKNIDVNIPLGKVVALTGISGSGKSTLMNDLIYQYSLHKFSKNKPKPQGVGTITGFENIDKVICIDQSPIGRTPRSNPATYTDVFTHIRDLYAKTTEAKMRGYKAGRFSFNVKGGRCEACKGDGLTRIEMNFLSDVYIKCNVCKGQRYNRETLEVKYKGKNISEVLEMSISEALEFFENIPKIKTRLQTLNDVGLGYMKLGQSATTLSGGEAQRIKLASELNKRATGKTLYLLDEPTVGLHWYDLDKLIKIINKLADAGNTILIIEHNLDLIKTADHIIDLGPKGGDEGGTVVAEGTPEEIAQNKDSLTGIYLKKILKKE